MVWHHFQLQVFRWFKHFHYRNDSHSHQHCHLILPFCPQELKAGMSCCDASRALSAEPDLGARFILSGLVIQNLLSKWHFPVVKITYSHSSRHQSTWQQVQNQQRLRLNSKGSRATMWLLPILLTINKPQRIMGCQGPEREQWGVTTTCPTLWMN